MDVTATLAVFGQLAVSLTGFAGLLTAFDSGHDGWTAAEIAALRNLFLNSVGALAFSVAPIPFLSGGVDPDMVMSIACLALALYFTALFIGAVDYVFRLKGKPRSQIIYWGFTLGEAPLAALLAFAAFGVGSISAVGAFCAGLMWLLAMGTAQFIFQIFWSLQAAGKR
ncbi:MAG: hypothetical protein ABL957_13070 [Parvularculaceae bacterium]